LIEFHFPPRGQSHTGDRKSDGGGTVEREKKSTHLSDITKEDKVSNSDDGLLIEHVEFLGDGCREEAATKDGRASLGDQTRV
jgi:hypothetical protein